MCGIFGVYGDSISQPLISGVLESLSKRGPDGHGIWSNEKCTLLHTRLSILDLSSNASQPMLSKCGSFVITYNGELFNFIQIRSDLESNGIIFKTNSDTEVVLEACIFWGIENALQKFDGMFAFGLFDIKSDIFYLARDHLGIKPLYYLIDNNRFAFSSGSLQLKMLGWALIEVNIDALAAYLKNGYIPAPYSIYSGVSKLPSGCYMVFEKGGAKIHQYFSINNNYLDQTEVCKLKTSSGLVNYSNKLHKLLEDTVKDQIVADVPLGIFLSGGIDSSLLAAIIQSISHAPINTFSLGFKDSNIDESKHAAEIAKFIGANHSEIIIDENILPGIIDEILDSCDEPFADNSVIPTFLISKLAKSKVSVCISGDGGDELFGGYPRYYWAQRIENLKFFIPSGVFRFISYIFKTDLFLIIINSIDKITFSKIGGSGGLYQRVISFMDYLILERSEIYSNKLSIWNDPSTILKKDFSITAGPSCISYKNCSWSVEMMLIDQQFYLQDDILYKLDKASMANSLEARVPYLSKNILNFSWNLPLNFKFSNSGDRGKLILRELLSRYLPIKLFDRPKQGFGLPLGSWLRGPLYTWANNLLKTDLIELSGLSSEPIISIWDEHLAGKDNQAKLWSILVYIHWWKRNFQDDHR